MRAFQIAMIQTMELTAFRQHTHKLWDGIYNKFVTKDKLNLGRWEHREDERKKEIKSIWANSDHCGDHICGQPEVIREITNMKKN